MTIFARGKDLGEGLLYIQTLSDQVINGGTKLSGSSGYTAAALAYAPRVWDKNINAWVPSSDIGVSKAVIPH